MLGWLASKCVEQQHQHHSDQPLQHLSYENFRRVYIVLNLLQCSGEGWLLSIKPQQAEAPRWRLDLSGTDPARLELKGETKKSRNFSDNSLPS